MSSHDIGSCPSYAAGDPPPPPPPVEKELNTAQKITNEVKKLNGLYDTYKTALDNLNPEEPNSKATLINAAKALGEALENIRRWSVNLSKETFVTEKGEVTKSEKKFIKKEFDPRQSRELIKELEQAFKRRKK